MSYFVKLLAPCLLLAACATPEERCVIDATRDLRTVETLIAETQANLQRGFAFDRTVERRPRLTFCSGSHRGNVGFTFCTEDDVVFQDEPVAIDPEAERRKLGLLRARRAELLTKAERKTAACQAG